MRYSTQKMIPFKSPQNSRFTLGLLEAGRMRLFIATLRQLRVLQETLWTRLVLLHPGKNIPKVERLSFGKCEKSVPKRGTFEFWVLTERGKCDEGKKIVCFF